MFGARSGVQPALRPFDGHRAAWAPRGVSQRLPATPSPGAVSRRVRGAECPGPRAGAQLWPRRPRASALPTRGCGRRRPCTLGLSPLQRSCGRGRERARGTRRRGFQAQSVTGVQASLPPPPTPLHGAIGVARGAGCVGAGRETQSPVSPVAVLPSLSFRGWKPNSTLNEKAIEGAAHAKAKGTGMDELRQSRPFPGRGLSAAAGWNVPRGTRWGHTTQQDSAALNLRPR